MSKIFLPIVFFAFVLFPNLLQANEVQSRYASVRYPNQTMLSSFNDNIELGRNLRAFKRKTNITTVEDEVLAKVDAIIEKAETILEMFPDKLHMRIVLLASSSEVSKVYKEKYNKSVSYLAFYSLSEKTIYISVDDASISVLAHEIGHAIVDHYFNVRPPYNVHELMAQFVEKRIND